MQENDDSPNLTSWGAKLSFFGHIAVFLCAVLWAWASGLFDFSKKEEPPTFELVPFNENPMPKTPAPQPKIEQFKPQKIQDLKPLDIPEPEPIEEIEPLPEKTPDPKPEVKPIEKKVTVAESNNATPPKKSYKDFLKENKINEKSTSTKPSKPKPKPVKINSVKVDASNFAVKLSETSSEVAGATQNELQAYYGMIYRILKTNWVMPEDCAGMDLVAKISLTISERGKGTNVRLVSSSGVKSFDESALRLFRVVTFPIPPRGKPLTLTIAFDAKI